MRLQIIIVALVIRLVGFAAPATAQKGTGSGGVYDPLGVPATGTDSVGSRYQDYLYGVIKKLDKDAMVLTRTKAGVDQTFKFNKKTKFIQDGKNSSLKSLKLGDKVWVDVDEGKKTGDLIARKVVTGVFLMPSN